MYRKCPSCGISTLFDRRKRTFIERVKTLSSTQRPHCCGQCGEVMMLEVGYREPKDIFLAVFIAVGVLLLLLALAMFH